MRRLGDSGPSLSRPRSLCNPQGATARGHSEAPRDTKTREYADMHAARSLCDPQGATPASESESPNRSALCSGLPVRVQGRRQGAPPSPALPRHLPQVAPPSGREKKKPGRPPASRRRVHTSIFSGLCVSESICIGGGASECPRAVAARGPRAAGSRRRPEAAPAAEYAGPRIC